MKIIKKDREAFLKYSKNVVEKSSFYIFTKPEKKENRDIADLFSKKQSLIYLKTWFLGDLKPQILMEPQLAIPAMTFQQGLNLVLNDRADAFLAPKNRILYALKNIGQPNLLKINSNELQRFERYIIFSKKSVSEDIYQKIDTSLKRILATGAMDNITNKYIY